MKYFKKILLLSTLAASSYSYSFAIKFYDYTPVYQPPIRNIYAAELAKKFECLKILIAELITATNQGNAEIVQNFMHTGAPANLRINKQGYDYHGWMLLHIAADQGHEEVVRVLINAGANPDAKVNATDSYHHGWTALHIAAWRYKTGLTIKVKKV